MARQARLDAPGTLHHVMIRGIEKGKIVDDRKDRQNFVDYMGQTALENDTKIYAWALMTNHAHILLKSGKTGLSRYMRRFLTRYAMNYNRRHNRHGYLFQNRYKSIICDEDSYFQELVRYIHLNPLRAKLVRSLNQLDPYPWCGHGHIMENRNDEWQDRTYVLKWFGKDEHRAIEAYHEHMQSGISLGRRPELVGGALVRSKGKWSEVSSGRDKPEPEKEMKDVRILGGAEFVEKIMKEAAERIKRQLPVHKIQDKITERIERICKREGVLIPELRSGGRRRKLSQTRLKIALELIKEYGVPLAELGRQLGVTTTAISRMLKRYDSDRYT